MYIKILDSLKVLGKNKTYSPNSDLMVIYHVSIRKQSPLTNKRDVYKERPCMYI